MDASKTFAELKSSRQELIDGWNQEKLRKTTVLIAGIGALGNEVAKNLAQLGIGKLILIDMDAIEYSNLNRTILFTKDDVGRKKVDVAKENLEKIAPDVKVEAYDCTLQALLDKFPNIFESPDVLMGCLDNMEARFLLNHISIFNRIPLVDGGMIGFGGSIQVVIPPYTPCLECNASRDVYANIGKRFSCTIGDYIDLTEAERRVGIPSVSTVTSVVAGLQSQEALKIILGFENFRKKGAWPYGIGKPVDGIIQYDGRRNTIAIIKIAKNPSCYVCGKEFSSSIASLYKRKEIKVNSNISLSLLKREIAGFLGKEKIGLVSGLNAIPNREEILMKIMDIRLKLDYIMRGLINLDNSKKKDRIVIEEPIFRVHLVLNDILKSMKRFEERADNFKEFEKLIRKLKLYISKSKPEVKKQMTEIVNELNKEVAWIRKYLSEEVPINALKINSFEELYAVDLINPTTKEDALIILNFNDTSPQSSSPP
jgi:molybdopterin/thiamine biosynthesis adenylyltransferase